MSRVSAVVMAHPTRADFVEELVAELDIPVVWDERGDRWHTGSRALLAFDPSADAHLVIQDDSIPCRDLLAASGALFDATSGEQPIALYTGKVRPHQNSVTPAVRRALRVGSPWLEMPGPWWGPGLIIPTAHIPDLVEWGNGFTKIKNYDRRIAKWYENRNIDCRYTVPSLVEHRGVSENPSLIAGRSGNRQAHAFIGDDSPLEIDWTLPPIRLNSPAWFHNGETGKRRRVRAGSAAYRQLRRKANWIEEIPDEVPRAA